MRICTVALFVIAAFGCGPKDNRVGVSGAVTFKGTPLAKGTIEFHPDKIPGATLETAMVVNGKYEIPKKQGLLPGTYRLVFSAADEKLKAKPDEAPGTGPVAAERLPAEWNTASKKTAVVTATGPNTFDFTIP